MNSTWYAIDLSQVVGILVTAFVVYVMLWILTRINGARSLTKMSSVDFVSTLVIGSLIASVIVSDTPSLLAGGVALTAVFALQASFAWVRRAVGTSWVENQPLLLMDGEGFVEDNLRRASVTVEDVRAKLRQANVGHLDQVSAVVLETSGSISVLHGHGAGFDRSLLQDVDG